MQEGNRRWDWLQENKEISQKTWMNDPWSWTVVWGLSEGVGDPGGGGKGGKIGTTVITKTIKYLNHLFPLFLFFFFLLFPCCSFWCRLLFCIFKWKIWFLTWDLLFPHRYFYGCLNYLCLFSLIKKYEIYLIYNIKVVSGIQNNDFIFVYIVKWLPQ